VQVNARCGRGRKSEWHVNRCDSALRRASRCSARWSSSSSRPASPGARHAGCASSSTTWSTPAPRLRDAQVAVRPLPRPADRADGPRAARRVHLPRPRARPRLPGRHDPDGRVGRAGAGHRRGDPLPAGRTARRRLRFAHDDYAGGDPGSKIEGRDARTLVIAQIETERGLGQVEEIAAVDGIDVLWVGHFDLSNFMGIPGRSTTRSSTRR
jgi:hypothetical protein